MNIILYIRHICKKPIVIGVLIFISICQSSIVHAGVMVGTDTTPTAYEITVTKIEFQNDAGGWVTFAQGSFTFDIASVGPSTNIGPVAEGNKLPPDTYVAVRVTFLNSFGLTGVAIDTLRLRTNTGNPSTGVFIPAGLTNVGIATQDAAPASKQVMPIPTDGAMVALLAANNITAVGGNLEFQQAVNFTVGSTMPSIQIDFNIQNG